jgi:integrase
MINKFLFTLCVMARALALFVTSGARRPTFEALAGEILEQKKLRAPGTHALAKIVLRRLVMHFGRMRVSEITETAWREYVTRRQAERPGCKLFDDKKHMSQVMLESFRRGIIPRKVQLWIPDRSVSGGREVTPPEIRKLVRAASADMKFQIEIAVKMGLRRKELLSLRWEMFDWKRRMIRVQSTKTGRARDVPINPDLVNRFRRRYLRMSRGSPCVFPGRFDSNRPIIDHKTAWKACKRRAGVKARWNDLRHTCATVMLRRGVSTRVVAKLLGNSEKVVVEWYDHLSAEDLRRANSVMSDRPRGRRTIGIRAKGRRPRKSATLTW